MKLMILGNFTDAEKFLETFPTCGRSRDKIPKRVLFYQNPKHWVELTDMKLVYLCTFTDKKSDISSKVPDFCQLSVACFYHGHRANLPTNYTYHVKLIICIELYTVIEIRSFRYDHHHYTVHYQLPCLN